MAKASTNKIRNSLDSELYLLDYLRTGFRSEVCALIPENETVEAILDMVLDSDNWKDCSGKDVPPPDFVSDADALMLEVMRVDDHERPGDRRGIVNPARAHETEIINNYEREFAKMLSQAADGASLTILGKTDLPTSEDHSYSMYLSGFRRIVSKHASRADEYRHNHPNHGLVFYIFDESTGYFESAERLEHEVREGMELRGRPHHFFADRAFLDVIKRSKADYFIWHTPFKHENLFAEGLLLPETVIYDVRSINVPELDYDETRMVSTEI
ncbi:hypothetical protein GMI69_08185 [Eggerthellaceae bacterium zg-887]|uniref:hypothetical protein n=1 Tax=Xiamenia xianingshaonis TaxID=2682776 RepID=UPI00140E10AE|nr:hypothetical protein [Xiamenia xianingshaonis]NHM16631.1 hypothetical protein [Xiamenia xianingshaonis]